MKRKKSKPIIDIKELNIIFENCDMMSFSKDDLEFLYMEEISNNISMQLNCVLHMQVAKHVAIGITKKAAKRKVPIFGNSEWKHTLHDRLGLDEKNHTKDIASFELVYTDGTIERIYPSWDGDDDYYNPAQRQFYNQEILVIEIQKGGFSECEDL